MTTSALAPRRFRSTSLAAIGLAVTLALGLAACGGSDDEDRGTPSTTTERSTTTNPPDTSDEQSTTTTTVDPSDGSEPGSDTEAAAVSIKDFAFGPERLEITAGTTVTFTNDDATGHTVTSTTGEFDSDTLGSGDTFEVAFDEAGTFEYFCEIHPNMTGTVVVA